ncbi:aldo/keto reductase [Streptomyces sp. NBC_01808]|uniref:aldo/keto reductase n=1 Tax=Streptomyces sp. NBC_01808 TaxID=2975947 RepID=UPI002DDBE81B|nr:aldo/keto reductase [Streptomyces sp. NBC_01808]WSA38404.1 aldo/keto reductase [Streptomyces sp. NBC_01808]
MEMRRLGADGPRVAPIGLGCSAMSGAYGPADEKESVATIHAAIDAGVTLLDTADFYGMGHNEWLIRQALHARDREKVVLSVKFGQLTGLDGTFGISDGRPAAVKTFLAYSLQRLGTDHVDIYRPARLDPAVPVEETVGAIAEAVRGGYVRGIGLSEVGPETIRRAHAVHPIADVQIEYSLFSRGAEAGVLQTCRELGIGVTAYGVLSRGLLSGSYRPVADATGARSHLPRFQDGNVAANLALVENLRKIAEPRGLTVAQLAIAWVLAQGRAGARPEGDVVALVGARRPQRIADAVAAAGLTLTEEELAAVERAVPRTAVAGERYGAAAMTHLDSER